jgi:Ca2+-binding RTX toxin-like protein
VALHRWTALGAAALLCLLIAALLPGRGHAAAATVYFDGGNGQLYIVTGPEADSITVRCVGGFVRVNGIDPSPGPARCEWVSGIAIQSGAGNDRIDTTGVDHATGFTHSLLDDPDPAHAIDVWAGAGNDVILDGYLRAGTLDGESGDDVIMAGGGREFNITGESGNDLLVGGVGNDGMYGGSGDDVLYGDKGRDFISGGPGSDRVYGGARRDFPDGNAGADLVDGGPGEDSVSGGAGADRVRGGAGGDSLSGGAGNDALDGDAGMDDGAGDAGFDRCRVEAATLSCEATVFTRVGSPPPAAARARARSRARSAARS